MMVDDQSQSKLSVNSKSAYGVVSGANVKTKSKETSHEAINELKMFI